MKKMKKIHLVLVSLVLALAMIVSVALPVSADAEVVGQVTVVSDGITPGFSGDLQLLSDGSISGLWEWTLFNSNGNEVKFCCEKLSVLSFPKENTAVFSGTFSCRNLPLDYVGHVDTISELSFEVIEVPNAVPANIGTAANPNGLPVALPPVLPYLQVMVIPIVLKPYDVRLW